MSEWVGVELRHLAAFAAVAEERSFRGAADRLGYVQSAVSQRISQLEQAVGVRLVERSRGHKEVGLTEAGRALLRHAERIETHLVAARLELRGLADDTRPADLRIGARGSLASRLVPAGLAHLFREAPEIGVELREAQRDSDLFEAVDKGELDAAFAELPLAPGPYRSRKLFTEPLVALVPRRSLLRFSTEPPTLAELLSKPFIVDSSWRMFDLVEAECATAGLQIERRYTVMSATAAQSLVAAGLGISIAPRLDVDFSNPDTAAIEISTLLPSRTVVCYWSADRDPSPELDRFLDAMTIAGAAQGLSGGEAKRPKPGGPRPKRPPVPILSPAASAT
jgi:DNA-binding transcriptional LysR family regulator